MHNASLLRAIFEYLHKNSSQQVAAQCSRCQALISGVVPPNAEAVQVVECPNCHALGAMFGSSLLPLSPEIMESNDSEAKRKHIISVLMKAIYGQLLPLITQIVGVETRPCSECGHPHPITSVPPGVHTSEDMEHMLSELGARTQQTAPVKEASAPKAKRYTKEEARRISDAYINLGVKAKENPQDEMLQIQLQRQRALYNEVKHLLS